MLLFVDESGHDHHEMPYEVLAGVALSEDNLWNVVEAIRSTEKEAFGDYLRNLRVSEVKAKRLLKRKTFRSAARNVDIPDADLPALAHATLKKGLAAHDEHASTSGVSERELVGYNRSVIRFVDEVLNIAARHNAQVFGILVKPDAPRPAPGKLRKDYVYLFERYFYFLETFPTKERGLIVFDELDKSRSHLLIQQMAAYFLGTQTGKYRSARIIPEPFFVHSQLTTGIFLADLAAYVLGWAWRLNRMTAPAREELRPFATKLHEMQFHGQKPDAAGSGTFDLHGILCLDDLRGLADR